LMEQGFCPWPLWGVAIGIAIAFSVLRRQSIRIQVRECNLDYLGQPLNIRVSGFIIARKKEELLQMRLCIMANEIPSSIPYSKDVIDYHYPDEVGDIDRHFNAIFELSQDTLLASRGQQEKGKAMDIARVSVETKSGQWLSPFFTIPFPLGMVKKTMGKAKKRGKQEPCITREEFLEVLEKASQPVKKTRKSEKEKP